MLDYLLSTLLLGKYAVLFVIVAAASLGVPIPATAILMAAGAFASQWYFEIGSVMAYAFVASVLGDGTGYFVSFKYGKEILYRFGFRRILASPRFTTLEGVFQNHSTSAIFTSRFLATGLWPIVNVLSGLSRVKARRFFFYDVLWECAYVVLFGGLWYVFGDQWEAVSSISGNVTSIIVLVVVLAVLLRMIWKARKRRAA